MGIPLHAVRKGWLQFFNRRLDGFGGLERIRAGRQFDAMAEAGLPLYFVSVE
jgi:hypothetical protein